MQGHNSHPGYNEDAIIKRPKTTMTASRCACMTPRPGNLCSGRMMTLSDPMPGGPCFLKALRMTYVCIIPNILIGMALQVSKLVLLGWITHT